MTRNSTTMADVTDDDLPGDITVEDCGDLGTLDAVLQGDYP